MTDFNPTEDYLEIENPSEGEVDITDIKITDRDIDGTQMAYLRYAQHDIIFKDVSSTDVVNRITGLEEQVGAKVLLHGEDTNDVLNAESSDKPYIIKGFSGDDTIVGGDKGDFLYGNDGNDILKPKSNMGAIKIKQADAVGMPLEGGTVAIYHPDMTYDFTSRVFSFDGGQDVLEGGLGEDTFHIEYNDSADITSKQAFYISDISAVDDELIITNLNPDKSQGLPNDLVMEDMSLYDSATNTSITGSFMDFADTQIFVNNLSAGLLRTIVKINDVNVTATPDDDLLYGSSLQDTISGYAGDDIIFGLAGDDVINGGVGNDTIHGGGSNATIAANANYISDSTELVYDDDGKLINTSDEYIITGSTDMLYGETGDDKFVFNTREDTGVQVVQDYEDREILKIIKNTDTSMQILTAIIDGVNSTLISTEDMDSAIIIPDYRKEQVRIVTATD